LPHSWSVPRFKEPARCPEIRYHFELLQPGSEKAAYVVTSVDRPTDEFESSEVLLIVDAYQSRFVVTSTRSYFDQTDIIEIRDLKRDAVVRSILQFPYHSKNRQDTLLEAHAAQKDHGWADIPITIEAGGISITGLESQWKNDLVGNPWKVQLRRAMDRQFLESIEEMRPLMHQAMLAIACEALTRSLLFEESCDVDSPDATKAIPPDCDFDASFDMECSDKQKKRISDAIEQKDSSGYY
jgi:hypothetical protein